MRIAREVQSGKVRFMLGNKQDMTELRRCEGKVLVTLMRSWLRDQRVVERRVNHAS